ncbi:MAG TPA: SipW-dependent-type signal peptide-containing protein [Gaiellaceae bacterium]|nr:SipW-dependent-type signal peptide-containing protein [Gaiellaceae bacterium]
MLKSKTKRYLVLLAAVGLVAAALGGTGTFASFNAETTNANTFQTGSITLGNKVNNGTVCYSSAGPNNANTTGCDAIFAAQAWKPGDSPTSENLTLNNTGSLPAATLSVWAPKLNTDGTSNPSTGLVCNYQHYTPGGDTNAFTGSGNPCTALQIQIQEYTTNSFGIATSTCVFPVDPSNPCSTNYAPLSTLASVGSPLPVAGGLGSGSSRFFTLTVKYPASSPGTADNAYQAQQTFFNLTWHIDQV